MDERNIEDTPEFEFVQSRLDEARAELAAAQKRVTELEEERDSAQLSADNNGDKAAQLIAWRNTLVNFVDQWTRMQKWNDGVGTPYADGKASAYEHCATSIVARFDSVRFEIERRAALAGDAGERE